MVVCVATELCPHCGVVRETVLTSTTDERAQADGTTLKIRTDIYHCGSCTGFVRSEEHVTDG